MQQRQVMGIVGGLALLISGMWSVPTRCAEAPAQPLTKVTAYAVMLGRARGCGIETAQATSHVEQWITAQSSPESLERVRLLHALMAGTTYYAAQQHQGKSMHICAEVHVHFARFPWP